MAQSADTGMQLLSSYRGRRISIISSSGIRFEGWSKDIFPEVQAISMEKVRFCGTESRRPDKHVAPRPEICDHIRVQLCDAKEIFVHVERAQEICTGSTIAETSDAVIPILWNTVRLENKEAGDVPPQMPTANLAPIVQETLVDVRNPVSTVVTTETEKSKQSRDGSDYHAKLQEKDRMVDEIVRKVRKDVEMEYGALEKYTWMAWAIADGYHERHEDEDSCYYRITLVIGLDPNQLVDILVRLANGKEPEFLGFCS